MKKRCFLLATIATLAPSVSVAMPLNTQLVCTSKIKAGLSFAAGKWGGQQLEAGASFTVSMSPSDVGSDLYLITLTDIGGTKASCAGTDEGGAVRVTNDSPLVQCLTHFELLKINFATGRFTLFQTAGYIQDDADGYMPPSVEGGSCLKQTP